MAARRYGAGFPHNPAKIGARFSLYFPPGGAAAALPQNARWVVSGPLDRRELAAAHPPPASRSCRAATALPQNARWVVLARSAVVSPPQQTRRPPVAPGLWRVASGRPGHTGNGAGPGTGPTARRRRGPVVHAFGYASWRTSSRRRYPHGRTGRPAVRTALAERRRNPSRPDRANPPPCGEAGPTRVGRAASLADSFPAPSRRYARCVRFGTTSPRPGAMPLLV